jgi:surface polysaccharide O-acyltransferase-like enzyme
LSGLFVWPSLARKGALVFMKDRLLRLGLPFTVIVLAIMPLAYYPSFQITGSKIGFADFWWNMITIGPWPAGPAWFIWLLLAFDAVAAGLWLVAPSLIDQFNKTITGAGPLPRHFFAILIVVSAIAYFAMALPFGTLRWLSFGPFAVQASRLLFYAVYFLAGMLVGAGGIERLSAQPGLVGRGVIWLAAGLAAYALLVILEAWRQRLFILSPTLWWQLCDGAAYVIGCAALCIACVALFLRFANGKASPLDRMRDQAYGIYLVHYVFVIWLQDARLDAGVPAILKGTIVFALSLAISWILVAALRRISWVASII